MIGGVGAGPELMVFLDLKRIQADEVTFDQRFPLPTLLGETGEPLVVGEAHVWGRAWRVPRGVELDGRWEAVVCLLCSRCLEPFQVPLDDELSLTLVGDAVEFGASEAALTADDARLFYVQGPRADLRSVAGEQLLLALPLKPVCSPDCAGLCPTCGAARNRIECGCPRAELDPRLAALRDFRNRMDRS